MSDPLYCGSGDYIADDMDDLQDHVRTRHRPITASWFTCRKCGGHRHTRLQRCYDRDGIRRGVKCADCNTEYACYAHGLGLLDADQYEGAKPQWLIDQEDAAFHREATRRGYVRARSDAP